MTTVPMLIDAEWLTDGATGVLSNPYTGAQIAAVAEATREHVDRAVAGLDAAFAESGPPHPYERFEILSRASRLIDERRDDLIATIVAESGFTVQDATGEVNRAIQTLLLSGEEARRLEGEMVPLDGAPGVSGRMGFTIRRPIGVVCAITPFNSPLNTVAHKIGPALGAGNAVVLKPASQTPWTAAKLCEILLDAGLPPRLLALIHGGGRTAGQWLLEDQRIGFYTFTGSTGVGETIQRTVGLRRTQLELGSISSTIVCEDAPLDAAVTRTVAASYRKAGQVCTSVQRLYVHSDVVDDVADGILTELAKRQVGDPTDPDTFVGPLITQAEAERVETWIRRAADGGARVLTGGERDGAVVTPAVLCDVAPDAEVLCSEVFGPVVSIVPYTDLERAVTDINATPYGLSAGVFTADIGRALWAAEHLRMGSVHVNQTSSSRVDVMPYGGVKESGFGKEGPRYAMRELTEERLVTITLP